MRPKATTNLLIAFALIGCRSPDHPTPWAASRVEARAAAEHFLATYPSAPRPIPVFVDGERVLGDERSGRFSVIDPTRIGSIQLLSGNAAEAKAGAAGRNGVIWIATR